MKSNNNNKFNNSDYVKVNVYNELRNKFNEMIKNNENILLLSAKLEREDNNLEEARKFIA